MKIKIFTTGGSIDKFYSMPASDFIVGEPQAAMMLHDANVTLEFDVESLLKKDSLQITDEDRAMILERVTRDPNRLIVLTHGTDSMIATAKLLTQVHGKTIVLTGAMQPATFKITDAYFNLGGAIIAVQTLPEGVYLVMNGQVFDPNNARKIVQENRFASMG
ncbi:MAG: asparaginase domain-containing protein [Chloroflexi bacterium]|nr:asparaginase domain-containing protein [Chloroflexota bacterium]